jgi:hypothetical protein
VKGVSEYHVRGKGMSEQLWYCSTSVRKYCTYNMICS